MEDTSKDEREDVQKKTFTKWINSQLNKGGQPPVTDLFFDLRDGTKLMALLEILTGHKIKREKGRMRVHHMNNVDRALKYLEEQNVKLVNISNDNIVDGSAKITLGLVWSIILHWQVQGVLREVMADLQQTNLEKTLLAWCRQASQGYQGVDIRNFTTSWRDGLAFCAILHHHRPDLFEWPVMAKKHPYARLDNAFRIAYDHLNIERLLDPEDVNTQSPDKKSVMMYVMCLFQVLPHSSFSVDNLDVSVQSDSSFSTEANESSQSLSIPSGNPGLGNYQQTLEEVLTWLLGAEDKLASMPSIADNTKDVKEQFHELEDLMLDLTSKQGGIGDVLGEGSRLLRENVLEGEEAEEVRLQMKLLNTRWEDLRVRAMDRQSKLHENLMKLQQDELEILKQWLTKTEDRIANMSQLGPAYQDLEEQLSSHQELQKDLESEQENINSLSNMVVVVDENSSDTASSSLEDDLNALGERWAHICKWAEQRWMSLQTLQRHWGELDRDMVKFGEWLDDKERILKEMESNPTNDHQEMLHQAAALKMLQSEMDIYLDRLSILQDKANIVLANLPKESTANEVVPLELESMQDRWEIFVSIVDAHSQRISASGIDISKIKISREVLSDVISSKTTFHDERSTFVTSTTTTTTTNKTVASDKMEGGSPKRQKMSSNIHEEFNTAFQHFSIWMEGVEKQVQPTATEKLTTVQLQHLCQKIEDELKANKEEYNKVLNLGHSATSETSTIGESTTVENEVKLTSVKTSWTSMQKLLNNLRSRIKFNQEIEKNQPKLAIIKTSCKELEEWINEIQSTISIDSSTASLQLEECQEKKLLIREREDELIEMEKVAHNLSSLFPEEKEAFLRSVQAAIFETKNIIMRICNWEFILKDTARTPIKMYSDSATNPFLHEPMDIVPSTESKSVSFELQEEFEDLTSWLDKTEQILSSGSVLFVLPKLQDSLRTYMKRMEEVDKKQDKLSLINDPSKKMDDDTALKVKNLNSKWETVVENLANRISETERGVERLHQFDEETSGMKSWLLEVETFLEAEDAAIGDVETLQAQLEQSNALQDDIVTLQDNMNSISDTGHHFLESGDEELCAYVTSTLKDIKERWEKAVSKAKMQNSELAEALKNSQKVWDDCKELNSWIDEAESTIPKTFSVETTSELNSICDLYAELNKKVSDNVSNYNTLRDFGLDIVGSVKVQTSSELKDTIEQLNLRWTQLVSEVESKLKLVTDARENYAKFKKLSLEEGKWLDDLELKIEKSSKESTDAEEISEALDDLDSFLNSHYTNGLDEIQKLADDVIKTGLMTVAVQNISHNLTTRYENLTSKAQDQQLRLEGGVVEAQDLEREYVKVLEHLSSAQILLYQFPDEGQLSQLEADHFSHREVLQTMERRVEEYKSQGKLHASQRLQDQLSHLMKQYDEFDEKFRLCQQATDFDSRLLTLSQLLSDTDQESRNFKIESVDPEHLEKQLNKCLVLYRSLSDVKSDVESLIATGRKLVKENMCSDPDTLTLQLDQLKALYNQLGGCVTEQRGRLESALKHSKKLEKDSTQLEEWLSHNEKELDLREASLAVQNIQHEIEFAQNALDDVTRKKPVVSGLQDSLSNLTSLCGESLTQPLNDQISDLTMTWERIHTRLINRVANMKKQDDSKEEEMEIFILKVGEIKAWLEKTEEQLSSIDGLSLEQKDKTLQNLSNEASKFKEEIRVTGKLSEDLIARGTLFESRLQPELLSINRRWENISSAIKVKTQDRPMKTEVLHGRSFLESSEKPELLNRFLHKKTEGSETCVGNSSIVYKSFEELRTKPQYLRTSSVDQIIHNGVRKRSISPCQGTDTFKEELTLIDENSKSSLADSIFQPKTNGKLSLVEVEKIETTLAKISFEVPLSSHSSESNSSVILNQEFRSKCTVPLAESETEPENLDDVIASLQKVAQKDDRTLIEKMRLKNLQKEDCKEIKETIFKHSKRDDDDLESLASVDTDFAPLSETSRDLECTYSDLESISESVSSRGDPLLVASREQQNFTNTSFSYEVSRPFVAEKEIKFMVTESFPIFPKVCLRSEPSTAVSSSGSLQDKYSKPVTTLDSSSQTTSLAKRMNYSSLPVEKLQAMIAELDDVLDSADSDSSEDEGGQETAISDVKSSTTIEEPLSNEMSSKFNVPIQSDISSNNLGEPESIPKTIEFKIQEVHVPGDYEFARAKTCVQLGPVKIDKPEMQAADVSVAEVGHDTIQTYQNNFPTKNSETCETKRVSIQASSISEVVRGVSVEVSRDNLLAKPETASFITLTSCPGSEESLTADKKSNEPLPYAIISSPIIEYPTTISSLNNTEIGLDYNSGESTLRILRQVSRWK